MLTNMFLLSDLLFVCWPPLDILLVYRQLWGGCDTGCPFGGVNPQKSAHMSHIYIRFQVYCCGSKKTSFLLLPSCLLLLEVSGLSHWKSIWPKLVCDLFILLDVCNPWLLPCPNHWFLWPFWSYSHAVSLIECSLLNFPGESWLSSLVCPSLDCVNSPSIFGVLYCNMVSYVTLSHGAYSSFLSFIFGFWKKNLPCFYFFF